jgi:hypothetical protein
MIEKDDHELPRTRNGYNKPYGWWHGVFLLALSYHVWMNSLQQKVSLYTKWFHWILIGFIGCSEQGPMKNQWVHWSNEQGQVNYTHIL